MDTKKLLADCARELDENYRKVGNPERQYEFYRLHDVAGMPLAKFVDWVYDNGDFCVELGNVLASISYALINSGRTENVREAKRLLERAFDVYGTMLDANGGDAARIVEGIILCRWLHAITHKIEGDYDACDRELRALLDYAESQRVAFDLGYSKSVLLPRRELAIIHDDREAFDALVDDIALIEDPREVFYTYRRALGNATRCKDEDRATALKGLAEDAYERCKDDLYAVYGYALGYTTYVYHATFGHADEAEWLYEELLPELEKNGYARYYDKLRDAHDMLAK